LFNGANRTPPFLKYLNHPIDNFVLGKERNSAIDEIIGGTDLLRVSSKKKFSGFNGLAVLEKSEKPSC